MLLVLDGVTARDLRDDPDRVVEIVGGHFEAIRLLREDLDHGRVPKGCPDFVEAAVRSMDLGDVGVRLLVSEKGSVVLEVV